MTIVERKAEIFDIIATQGQLKAKYEEFEQYKQQKLQELQKAIQEEPINTIEE